MTGDAATASVAVALPAPAAFDAFTARFADWWPPEYTWSGDALQAIAIAAGVGGLCSEHGPHGFRCDWGRVLAWEPPERLAFTWQIGPHREPVPDPAGASEVAVTFVDGEDGRCRVELVHAGFARHGPEGGPYRDMMASEQGWPYILGQFAEAAEWLTSPP